MKIAEGIVFAMVFRPEALYGNGARRLALSYTQDPVARFGVGADPHIICSLGHLLAPVDFPLFRTYGSLPVHFARQELD